MSKKLVTFRKVKTSDEHYFSEWWRNPQIIHLTSGGNRRLSYIDLHKLFVKLLNSRTAKHWMVIGDGRPIGHVTVRGQKPVEVQIMIGLPKQWSCGYGTAIGNKLRQQLRRSNINHARMYVWRQNRRSIALGKKFGFKLTGRVNRRIGSTRRIYLRLDYRVGGKIKKTFK